MDVNMNLGAFLTGYMKQEAKCKEPMRLKPNALVSRVSLSAKFGNK